MEINRPEMKERFPEAYRALEEGEGDVPYTFFLRSDGLPAFTEEDELYSVTYAWDGTTWAEVNSEE